MKEAVHYLQTKFVLKVIDYKHAARLLRITHGHSYRMEEEVTTFTEKRHTIREGNVKI